MAKRQIRDYVFTPGVAGSGVIKVLDKVNLDTILLITNVTRNKILYTFSDPTNQITLNFHPTFDGSDPDFPYANTISNGVTEIELQFDTSDQSSTDALQIFVESEEIKFRPYNFGTDAIERMRVATPQSMLDADFEYGLQPTKWQTIDLMRGYPSIYEVPGSELSITEITTNASSQSGGVGDSIITVTTPQAHDLSVGDPVRIFGLNDAIPGASRAQGSFVIFTVPSTTTFTYYSKGKVGTVNGTSLVTSFSQMRKGGYYTGASIGNPTFNVESQGSSGSFVTNLRARSSSNKFSSTDVSSLVIGSILSQPNPGNNPTLNVKEGDTLIFRVNVGIHNFWIKTAQTTGTGDGVTEGTITNNGQGNTGTVTWDTTGVTPGTYYYICQIHGTMVGTINVATASGTTTTYDYNVVNSGSSAYTFSINSSIPLGSQVTGIANTSSTKTLALDVIAPSNTITINGDTSGIQFGSAVDDGTGFASYVTNLSGNTITLSDPILVNKNGSSNVIGLVTAYPSNFGQGSGCTFNVERNDGKYIVTNELQKTGSGVLGSNRVNIGDVNGVTINSKVIGAGIGVDARVSAFVGIQTVVLSVPNSAVVNGIVTFSNPGIGYSTIDRVLISGSSLGGISPNNDLVIKVDSVDSSGGITSFTTASTKQISVGGEAKLSTSQFIDGGSSLLLDPTVLSVDYVSVAPHPELGFGTGRFTIDFWIYRNRTSVIENIFDMRTSTTEIAPSLYIDSSNKLNLFINGSNVITGITTLQASTWYHIALSKDNVDDTTRLFVNGALEGTYNDTNNYPQKPIVIGARYDITFGFYGYIDNLRVSKGLTRFISAFTPTLGFVPNDPYNVLFLRFNGSSNSTNIIDDSYGTAVSSSFNYAVSGVPSGSGSNALFSVFRVGGASPSYTVNIINAGNNYSNSEIITVDGSLLGGISGVNNLQITVTGIDGGGGITAFTFSGTASNGNASYLGITPTNSGTGVEFIPSKSGSNYIVQVQNGGSGYYPGYQFLVSGSELGGTTPTNDLTIRVDSVEIQPSDFSFGKIITVSGTGTPVVGDSITFYPSITMSEITTGEIPSLTTINYSSLARILVGFSSNHGLVPGDTALVSITSSGTNHSLAAGPRIVDAVPTLNQLVYTVSSPGTISPTGIVGNIYPRPDCFYVHRPFDGGVQLGTGGPAHGAHAIRQSKKYLRYQSGKGIMYTTGTLFAPAYDLRSINATGISTGSVITVTTDDVEHGLQIGAEIIISNVTTSGYDGTYVVNGITNESTFTVLAKNELGSTTATLGTQAQVSLYKWKGATVRAGAFDEQNGIFWQYDGVNLAVGLRSATYQLAGTVGINTESNNVVGTNTRFREQLIVGDRIVIRGMTHVVTNIASNTSMTVTPDFRGVRDVSGVKAALINEIIVTQHEWNIDRCDGQGPSGYHLEVNKMQMIGFQYTWYGAGFIDWMLRGPNGDYLFIHRLKNNNRNTEAFMRSGNLPVRYEVVNEGAKTRLVQDVGIGSTIIHIDNTELMPSSGSIYIDNEIINYTGIDHPTHTLTGITRSATFSNFYSGSQRSYTAGIATDHSTGTGIVLLSNTATPVISHWGSAFLTDGLFDADRGYIFNYQSVNFTISSIRTTAFLIRLAPSVSNAITGDLGERELINRAQLLLQGIEFTATGGSANQGVIVEGVLNPQNYPTNPDDITWFGLSNAATGGQPSFAQIADGTSVNWGAPSSFTATNSIAGNSYSGNKTNLVYFTPASVVNAKVGQIFSGSGVPGGTLVQGIFDSQRFPGNKYITLSQSIDRPGAIGASTYTFTEPTLAANPGETVFSFIGNGGGGNTSSLDLRDLKELNNTPIGGRGTFPNGPDVLAINVYSTGGTDFTGSLVLRWGEAQA